MNQTSSLKFDEILIENSSIFRFYITFEVYGKTKSDIISAKDKDHATEFLKEWHDTNGVKIKIISTVVYS